MKPTPTTCMEISSGIPNRLHASGIKSREPPATPEAPAALAAASTHMIRALPMDTLISRVLAAARAMVEMVMAAPAMLTVDPNGMEMEYVSSSSPSFLHSSILTGMLAAELLVKKAVIKLSFKQVKISL